MKRNGKNTAKSATKKKPRLELPNDFAYLSGDIMTDIVDAHMNPWTWQDGSFNRVRYVKGDWKNRALTYSFVECQISSSGPRFERHSGLREVKTRELQFDELLPSDAIRHVKIRYTDLSECPNISALMPRMMDRLEITGSDVRVVSALKLLPDTFAEISFSVYNPETPSDEEHLALERQVIERLRSKHLRKFKCEMITSRERTPLNLEAALCEFLSKPSFQLVRLDFSISLDVVAHAVQSWRNRSSFPVSKQKLVFPWTYAEFELEEFFKSLFPAWTFDKDYNTSYSETHPLVSDRILTCTASYELAAYYRSIVVCFENEQ
uniref:FTH domain-containing protein n=1 Tax=Steinernema glaseri TaxID=37863 RepID=A0A1I7YX28_9BILA